MGEIQDITVAARIAREYLGKNKGAVVFGKEIKSIFKQRLAWFVEIESKAFTGVVVIKSATGEVAHVIDL